MKNRIRYASIGMIQNCFCSRSLRQDQVVGREGEEDRQEEEDDRQERQPQPILQRVLRLHGRSK